MSARKYLSVVKQTGQPRSTRVPSATHAHLELYYGEPLVLVLYVQTDDGTPINMDGKDAVLTVKRSTDDAQIVFSGGKTASPSEPLISNMVEVTVSLDSRWKPGRYVYDVWLHDGLNRDLLIPASTLRIVPTAGSATSTP